MTTGDTQTADAQSEMIQAAAQAAIRADSGEYVFPTRTQVSAFVNALPSDVRVRWHVESTVGFGQQYRVTFWRSFWRGGRKANASAAGE